MDGVEGEEFINGVERDSRGPGPLDSALTEFLPLHRLPLVLSISTRSLVLKLKPSLEIQGLVENETTKPASESRDKHAESGLDPSPEFPVQ